MLQCVGPGKLDGDQTKQGDTGFTQFCPQRVKTYSCLSDCIDDGVTMVRRLDLAMVASAQGNERSGGWKSERDLDHPPSLL
jgi:hypothetical protein